MAEDFDTTNLTAEEIEQRKIEQSADQQLAEMVALGEEAKEFLNGPLAEYIIGSAASKVELAYKKLAKIDPSDLKGIVELQTEIAKFDLFNNSLFELVAAGDQAYRQFREGESQ